MISPIQPLLELRDATLGYPDKVVLEHLDWCVRRGERWAITGPNGSGKTTPHAYSAGAHPATSWTAPPL